MDMKFEMDLYQANGNASPTLVYNTYKEFLSYYDYDPDVKVSIAASILKSCGHHIKFNRLVDTSESFEKEKLEPGHIILLNHFKKEYTKDKPNWKKMSFLNAFNDMNRQDPDINRSCDPKFLMKCSY